MIRRRRASLIVAGLAVLAAGLWIAGQIGSPQTLTIDVTGEAGREVAGTVTVDGTSQRLAGTLPATFEYRGRRIEYAIAPVGGGADDHVTVQTAVDGRPSSTFVGRGVKGSIDRGGFLAWWRRHDGIGGMTAAEVAELTK